MILSLKGVTFQWNAYSSIVASEFFPIRNVSIHLFILRLQRN